MSRPDGRQGYAATSDPPPGARPARDTGVSANGILNLLTRQRDELLQERDAARAVAAAARQTRDEALGGRDALHYEIGRLQRLLAERQKERDAAREAIAFVLEEHHLGYCTLSADTLTILTAAGDCKKEEEAK